MQVARCCKFRFEQGTFSSRLLAQWGSFPGRPSKTGCSISTSCPEKQLASIENKRRLGFGKKHADGFAWAKSSQGFCQKTWHCGYASFEALDVSETWWLFGIVSEHVQISFRLVAVYIVCFRNFNKLSRRPAVNRNSAGKKANQLMDMIRHMSPCQISVCVCKCVKAHICVNV